MISPAIFNFRRAELERWIDNAIALLDQIDGDPDLEDDDVEVLPKVEPVRSRTKRGGSNRG
jgi:hypothetical protein